MTHIATTHVRAAGRVHFCGWCADPIEVGASYVRQRNSDEVGAWTFITHPECYAVAGKLDSHRMELHAGVIHTRGCVCEQGDHDGCEP